MFPTKGARTPRTQKITLASCGAVGAIWGWQAAIIRRYRGNGNAVTNDNGVITDEHLFDDEAHDALAFGDLERVGGATQTGEKVRERTLP